MLSAHRDNILVRYDLLMMISLYCRNIVNTFTIGIVKGKSPDCN